MDKWINDPIELSGETVSLVPLQRSHFGDLKNLSKDKRIWEYYPVDLTNTEKFNAALDSAIQERDKGSQYPFVVFHNKDQKVIGSTRYLDIQSQHRKLEIGWTWLHPDYWATKVNVECKLLLLTHCFESLQASRVFLKTDDTNLRSKKAIQKIGGKFEGVLRSDVIRENGTKRNSAYYSIIEEEWMESKQKLINLLQKSFNK